MKNRKKGRKPLPKDEIKVKASIWVKRKFLTEVNQKLSEIELLYESKENK